MNQLSNNKFLAYIRVSSKDQSRGTSLIEQKSYIERYAKSKGFIIVKFYGEVESASKTGREIFDEMIKKLKKDKLQGIIFHKVDRSARNPRDQALLYELMQEGYELHFVAEGLNTTEPMGKNLLYIMWGLASSYSENLKMEINKGISGLLKQGKWPLPALLGYKKSDGCKCIIDEMKGPLIKNIFEQYSTGKYSVKDLVLYTKIIGLTNTNNNELNKNSVDRILRNTFYYGLITHKRGTFEGEHEPLISRALFEKVQHVLKERGFEKKCNFDYIFRGLLKCQICGRRLKSMTSKKRWKYYHCRDWNCGVKTIAEPLLEEQFVSALKELEFNDEEEEMFKKALISFKRTLAKSNEDQIKAMNLELANIENRIEVLLQKFVDQKIDDETYSKTREALLNKKIEIRERINFLENADKKTFDQMEQLVKLLKNPVIAFQNADIINKRRLIISMVENFSLSGKTLIIEWKKPFDIVAKRPKSVNGGDDGT